MRIVNLDVPVTPDAPEAQEWLQRELSKTRYQFPDPVDKSGETLLQRILRFLQE